MKAKISGMVVAVYNRDGRDRDGKAVVIPTADVYIGHEIIKVSRVDESFAAGVLVEDAPVNVYAGQYGLSVVYDNSNQ